MIMIDALIATNACKITATINLLQLALLLFWDFGAI